jgi:hypothetical protein
VANLRCSEDVQGETGSATPLRAANRSATPRWVGQYVTWWGDEDWEWHACVRCDQPLRSPLARANGYGLCCKDASGIESLVRVRRNEEHRHGLGTVTRTFEAVGLDALRAAAVALRGGDVSRDGLRRCLPWLVDPVPRADSARAEHLAVLGEVAAEREEVREAVRAVWLPGRRDGAAAAGPGVGHVEPIGNSEWSRGRTALPAAACTR